MAFCNHFSACPVYVICMSLGPMWILFFALDVPHVYIYISSVLKFLLVNCRVQDSPVIKRWAMDRMTGGSSSGRGWEFLPALGPTQPPIQRVPGIIFLGIKRPKREADHSPPDSAEVKNSWSYTSPPQYASIVRIETLVNQNSGDYCKQFSYRSHKSHKSATFCKLT
jgi:hypothetical protein